MKVGLVGRGRRRFGIQAWVWTWGMELPAAQAPALDRHHASFYGALTGKPPSVRFLLARGVLSVYDRNCFNS